MLKSTKSNEIINQKLLFSSNVLLFSCCKSHRPTNKIDNTKIEKTFSPMFTAIDTVDTFVLHLLFLCFVANPGSLDVCEKVQRYVGGIKVYK